MPFDLILSISYHFSILYHYTPLFYRIFFSQYYNCQSLLSLSETTLSPALINFMQSGNSHHLSGVVLLKLSVAKDKLVILTHSNLDPYRVFLCMTHVQIIPQEAHHRCFPPLKLSISCSMRNPMIMHLDVGGNVNLLRSI